jgi:hypothetical protein
MNKPAVKNPKVSWLPNAIGETLKVGLRQCGTIWRGRGVWMASLIQNGKSAIHGPFVDKDAAVRFLYLKCAPWMVSDGQDGINS